VGDCGFDPLGLARADDASDFSPDAPNARLAKMREAELLHARWAMLAAPGALLPEWLSNNGCGRI
jgi:light-harvesting complex II chlorophyll a/b binding protein 5